NLKGSHLRRIGLKPPEFRSVSSQQILFLEEFGRLRAVTLGPDGYIYFSTSNRDGRGRPFPGDDKILRLIPEDSEPPLLVQAAAQGNFSLELESGTYRLVIAAPGFSPYQRRLVVEAGQQIDLGLVQLSARAGGSNRP
ncbi:MAG: PQQ-dependent sugar dehydrogenase, partial [Acidobacteria bacterium]|nr:PQQ-dependent sugar dehydrogenase [Acidobacteriota bacterium]